MEHEGRVSAVKRRAQTGVVFAALLGLVLCYVLFANPRIGGVNFGQYDAVIQEAGLSYRAEDPLETRYYDHVIEQFDYEHFDFSTLLRADVRTSVYGISLVRALTEPLGLGFSTVYLAIVYILVIMLGMYLIASALEAYSSVASVAVGLAVLLVFMRPEIAGYLNSLYDQGAVIASLMLFAGISLYAMALPKGGGMRFALYAILAAGLLLRAHPQMLLLLPAVLVSIAITDVHCCPPPRMKYAHILACVLLSIVAVQGGAMRFAASSDLFSDATDYQAFFQGLLPASEDVEADLRAFGLAEGYAADVGKSYYGRDFAFDPNDEAVRAELFSKIGMGSRLQFLFQHPDRILAIARSNANQFTASSGGLLMGVDNERPFRFMPVIVFDLFASFEGLGNQLKWMWLGAGAWCVVAVLGALRKRCAQAAFASALMLNLSLYPLGCFALAGTAGLNMETGLSLFFATLGLMGGCAAVVVVIGIVSDYIANEQQPFCAIAVHHYGGKVRKKLAATFVSTRRRQIVWVAALSCVLLIALLLLPVHIGAVNNGDFGRVMEHLGIRWPASIWEDSAAQSGRTIIEQYDYYEPLELARLTPAEPTYSLIYPSLVVRLFSHLTGHPFDTRVMAVVLAAAVLLSILSIVRDAYPRLGKWTFLLGIGLVVMMFGENYIAMYNSLFGEGTIATSILMVNACGFHLCVLPRGGRGKTLWLVLFGFSSLMLVCAKAQMLLAMPVVLALLIGFAVYHHPKKRIAVFAQLLLTACMCVFIGANALGVYQGNSQVSDRNTIWHSVFNGALVIADDPVAVLEDLGVDTAMVADINKHSYLDESEYVYAPQSDEAYDAFYSKVNTFTMVGYYLRHPSQLWTMLNYAAESSKELYNGFMTYTYERYDQPHDEPYRFTLWSQLRTHFSFGSFLAYLLLYGAMLVFCLRMLFSKKASAEHKWLAALFVAVMAIGVFQFPLSVIGNGLVDNNKQMFGFMLCHDLLVFGSLVLGIKCFADWIAGAKKPAETEKEMDREESGTV